ncbi:MAG: GNAT family N-acetyltransferase [Asgard group archaeon]|nr:GNAT family N-acetyltransferase [Asgard group archaeon]
MSEALRKLYTVKRKDVKKGAEVFAQAFAEDKLSNYMYADEESFHKALLTYFNYRITYGLLYGEVYAPSANLEGLAVWYRDDQYSMSYWRNFRAGGMKLLRYLGSDTMKRMVNLGNYTVNLRKECISEPYWYLEPIGIDPAFQGKGYASLLIRAMLERIDSEQLLAVLETQTPKNVEIYKRYGFDIIKETIIPDTTIAHWLMTRKPQNKR